jgi:thioredoxin-like negative regulator of GroEL
VLWLERSCQLRSKRHENDSLGTQHQLAVAYREDGQNTKALELLEAILEAMNELAY